MEGACWDVLDRLHKKGMIDNPVGKMKSVVFTDEGLKRAKTLRSIVRARIVDSAERSIHLASCATPSISISIFGSGSATTTQVVRAG